MKILKSILAVIAVILVVGSVAGLIFIRTHGKAVLEKVLSRSFDKKVTIDTLTYIPPLTLVIDALRVEKDFYADKATVELKPGSVAFYIKHKLNAAPIDLEIKSIWIEKAKVSYPLLLPSKTIILNAKDVEFVAENVTVPLKDEKTAFSLKGVLVDTTVPMVGDRIEAAGWVNYVKKDMDATAKLFNPEGRASLTAKAVSADNDMQVAGTAILNSRPLFKSDGEKNKSALEQVISQAVEAMQVVVTANFSFTTKMDKFKIEQVSFTGNVSAQ